MNESSKNTYLIVAVNLFIVIGLGINLVCPPEMPYLAISGILLTAAVVLSVYNLVRTIKANKNKKDDEKTAKTAVSTENEGSPE